MEEEKMHEDTLTEDDTKTIPGLQTE